MESAYEPSPLLVVAHAKAQEVGAHEEIAPEAAGELGAGAHAPLAASPAISSCSRPAVEAVKPKTQEAAAPATQPRAFLATPCPPSSGKREQPLSRSSAFPGSSGGRLSLPTDTPAGWVVVGRNGRVRSREKDAKKARERRASL